MKKVTQITVSLTLCLILSGFQTLYAQPVNDDCSGAIAVGTLPWTSASINVRQATLTGEPGTPSCQPNVARSIWFTFTPTTTGQYYLSTCQSDAPGSTMPDIVLAVYTSSGGCGGTFTEIDCNDDGCSLQSVIPSINLTGGTTYYIVAWQYCNGCTAPTMSDRFIQLYVNTLTPPANDDCLNATNLGTGSTINTTGNNTNATSSSAGDVSCDFGGGLAPDVWYKFTTDANGGNATVVVGGTGMDIVIAAYSSCGGAEIACSDNTGNGANETMSLNGLAANTTVFLRVYEYFFGTGSFNINISGTALPLELASFSGKTTTSSNMLEWETITEKNVQWHILERSVDGIKWSETGRKTGQMDSQSPTKYELEDLNPLAKSYYRLRSIDYDGQENFSNTIILTRKSDHFGITAAFPSPTKDKITIQFASLTEENVSIQIRDITGRLVLEQQFAAENGINEVPVQLNSLQAGVYLVGISNSSLQATPVRIIKE